MTAYDERIVMLTIKTSAKDAFLTWLKQLSLEYVAACINNIDTLFAKQDQDYDTELQLQDIYTVFYSVFLRDYSLTEAYIKENFSSIEQDKNGIYADFIKDVGARFSNNFIPILTGEKKVSHRDLFDKSNAKSTSKNNSTYSYTYAENEICRQKPFLIKSSTTLGRSERRYKLNKENFNQSAEERNNIHKKYIEFYESHSKKENENFIDNLSLHKDIYEPITRENYYTVEKIKALINGLDCIPSNIKKNNKRPIIDSPLDTAKTAKIAEGDVPHPLNVNTTDSGIETENNNNPKNNTPKLSNSRYGIFEEDKKTGPNGETQQQFTQLNNKVDALTEQVSLLTAEIKRLQELLKPSQEKMCVSNLLNP